MNWSISEVIPQKEPFVFIDEVIEFTELEITTNFTVRPNATLVSGDILQEAALIENIAQSAAALEGCNAKQKNSKVKIGFIGSVKKLKILRNATVGQTLHTKVKIVNNVMDVNIAEGEVKVDGELIAQCIINIFLKNE